MRQTDQREPFHYHVDIRLVRQANWSWARFLNELAKIVALILLFQLVGVGVGVVEKSRSNLNLAEAEAGTGLSLAGQSQIAKS